MAISVYTPPSDRLLHNTEVDFGGRYKLGTPVHLMQYDKSLPIVVVKLYMNGIPFKLASGASVNIRVGKRDGTTVYNPVLGCDTTRTIVYCEMTKQICAEYGPTPAILELMIGENIAGSSYIMLDIAQNPVQENAVESSDEYKTIMEVIADAKQALDKVPIIQNGTFWVWDTTSGKYVDTGESAAGEKGDTGNGISSCTLNSNYTLTLNFTDGTSYTTPVSIRGATGAKGNTGVGITNTILNDDYTLTVQFSDGSSYTSPSIRGAIGPKGETGKGLKILGYFVTASALSAGVSNPEAGDAYGVGSAAPYDIYMWDASAKKWVNNGSLQGVKGDDGVTFTPSVTADGTMSWTNDGGLANPEPVNLRGPAGKDGTNGKDGKDGNDAAADKTLGINNVDSTLMLPMITEFNDGGQPTKWMAKDIPSIMGWYGIRAAFIMLYAKDWIANPDPNPDSPTYGAYYMDVTDSIFDMVSGAPAYWYICVPRSESVVDYYNHRVAIDPDTIEAPGKRRFYCSAVNGKAPEAYIEVCVIGFPTSYQA